MNPLPLQLAASPPGFTTTTTAQICSESHLVLMFGPTDGHFCSLLRVPAWKISWNETIYSDLRLIMPYVIIKSSPSNLDISRELDPVFQVVFWPIERDHLRMSATWLQSLSPHPHADGKSREVSKPTNHFWSFTATQCCSSLLNSWSRWGRINGLIQSPKDSNSTKCVWKDVIHALVEHQFQKAACKCH